MKDYDGYKVPIDVSGNSIKRLRERLRDQLQENRQKGMRCCMCNFSAWDRQAEDIRWDYTSVGPAAERMVYDLFHHRGYTCYRACQIGFQRQQYWNRMVREALEEIRSQDWPGRVARRELEVAMEEDMGRWREAMVRGDKDLAEEIEERIYASNEERWRQLSDDRDWEQQLETLNRQAGLTERGDGGGGRLIEEETWSERLRYVPGYHHLGIYHMAHHLPDGYWRGRFDPGIRTSDLLHWDHYCPDHHYPSQWHPDQAHWVGLLNLERNQDLWRSDQQRTDDQQPDHQHPDHQHPAPPNPDSLYLDPHPPDPHPPDGHHHFPVQIETPAQWVQYLRD